MPRIGAHGDDGSEREQSGDEGGEPEARTDGGSKYRDGYVSPDDRERNREALAMRAQRRRTKRIDGHWLGRRL